MSDRRSKTDQSKPAGSGRKAAPSSLSRGKKILFAFFSLVLVFGLIELILLAVGVKPLSYGKDPYVGFSSQIPLFIEKEGSDSQLVTARNKLAFFNKQEFPEEKPADTTRIFCLGGSTTYGRPYDDTTSFCGWLRELLPAAAPTRKWEVINAGGISYASYRVAALMEELAEHQPDLFIIYCGHNEFLERRTYSGLIEMPESVRGLSAVLSKTRTYSSLARLIRGTGDPATGEADELNGEVTTILDRSVGPADYERDDELQAQVLDHFRFNMTRMVDIARAHGAEVLFVTPASNLRHCSPFKSEHREGLGEREKQEWQTHFDRAQKELAKNEEATALDSIDQALAIDDRHAQAHYLRGRALFSLGEFEKARLAYQKARDEDVCPLRALSPMPGIVREVASGQKVPVVDYHQLVEDQSPHGIPGDNLFLDHVHPTIDGHRMLALALIDKMANQGWVEPSDGWKEKVVEPVAAAIRKKVDPKKQGVAMRNLSKVFAWAGKMEDAYAAAQKALELFPGDAEAYYQVGNLARQLGQQDEAIAKLSHLVSVPLSPTVSYYLKAHLQLSDLLSEKGEFEKSEGVARKLMTLDPGNPAGRDQLVSLLRRHSQTLLEKERPQEAAQTLAELATLQPDDFEIQVQQAVALVRAGNFPSAVRQLRKLIGARPDFLPAYDNLSFVLAQLGRLQEAKDVCLQALKINPAHQAAQKNLALIRKKMATNPE